MAGQTDFKHITVNPAEADDVVIHAGAPVPRDEGADAHTEAAPQAQARPALYAGAASADAVPAPQAAAASPDAGASNASPAPKRQDAYRQTTLEDIQSFKMSKTQVAVIVVALAAIAAFVVWYLVFS